MKTDELSVNSLIRTRHASASWQLMIPTAFTPALIEATHGLLERVYKLGFEYRKAGIFLTDITYDNEQQQSFFLKSR